MIIRKKNVLNIRKLYNILPDVHIQRFVET